MEIIGVGDVDVVLVLKKSFKVSSPVGVRQTCKVDGNQVSRLSRFDIGVELLDVHDGDSLEDGDVERGCLKGQCQLFINKDWMKIMRIDGGIVAASVLIVDILLSS